MKGINTELLDRLHARLDAQERAHEAQERELVTLRATLAGIGGAPSPVARTAPTDGSEAGRPVPKRAATRRGVLKGAGALVFTTALLATGEVTPVAPYRVAAADPPARPSGPNGPSGPAIAANPDTVYQSYEGTDFQPLVTSKGMVALFAGIDPGAGNITMAAGGINNFAARLNLPQGATITELIFYVFRNDTNGMAVGVVQTDPNDTNSTNTFVNVATVSSSIQAITLTPNMVVDNTQHTYAIVWFASTAGLTQSLYGARVGYTLPNSAQVYGAALAGIGVYGTSTVGTGVRGDAVTGTGVIGNAGLAGSGVLGSTSTTLLADQRAGVVGMSNFPTAPAVYGHATVGNTNGVHGSGSGMGAGVYGVSAGGTGTGVLGQDDVAGGTGVKGVSASGFPIIGNVTGTGSTSNTAAGVLGSGTAGPGVQGQSTSGHGLVGTTNDGAGHAGLIGNANNAGGIGLMGIAPNFGTASVGLAGDFFGNVKINGGALSSPAMQTVAQHAGDNTFRALHSVASPESWFEDFGKGTLAGGKADVKLDPDFAALVQTEDYHVFLTAHGPQSLYVPQQSASGFTVEAMQGASTGGGLPPPPAAGTFAWRVVAKRKDIAGARLAKVAAPSTPPRPAAIAIPESPDAKP